MASYNVQAILFLRYVGDDMARNKPRFKLCCAWYSPSATVAVSVDVE